MYSVKFLPDLVQFQARKTVSGILLARIHFQIQVWHMVEVMRRDFNEHLLTQVPITGNQLGKMWLIEEVSSMWEWTTPILLTLDMWIIRSMTSIFLGRRRWDQTKMRCSLKQCIRKPTTTTTSDGSSNCSAFYRKPLELSTDLWLIFFANNRCLSFISCFLIIVFFSKIPFNCENIWVVQGETHQTIQNKKNTN